MAMRVLRAFAADHEFTSTSEAVAIDGSHLEDLHVLLGLAGPRIIV